MPSKTIPLALPLSTAPGRDGFVGGNRLVNCYAQKRIVNGKAGTLISPVAGLKSFVTLAGATSIRGMIEVDGVGYVVADALLYSVTSSGVATLLGAIPGAGPVSMARNRRTPSPDIIIVSDGLVYLTNGSTVSRLSDEDLPPPNGVVVINGYAVYTIADGRILASAIDNAGNWLSGEDWVLPSADPGVIF